MSLLVPPSPQLPVKDLSMLTLKLKFSFLSHGVEIIEATEVVTTLTQTIYLDCCCAGDINLDLQGRHQQRRAGLELGAN